MEPAFFILKVVMSFRRKKENMKRLNFNSNLINANAENYMPNFKADVILIDAPCDLVVFVHFWNVASQNEQIAYSCFFSRFCVC